MDFVTAQARVADYLDWSGTNATTKTKNWINDIRLEIAGKYNFEYLFTEATQTTTTENTYAWPSDILDHLTIFLDDSNGNPITLYEMTRGYYANKFKIPGSTAPSTEPYHIIRKGTDFQIYPDPTAGRTLTLWYYSAPATLSADADTDYMLTVYSSAVIFGAAWLGAIYLDDDIKVAKYQAKYGEMVNDMVRRESGKKGPRIVRMKHWSEFEPDVMRKKFDSY